jgi:hypothetical protein
MSVISRPAGGLVDRLETRRLHRGACPGWPSGEVVAHARPAAAAAQHHVARAAQDGCDPERAPLGGLVVDAPMNADDAVDSPLGEALAAAHVLVALGELVVGLLDQIMRHPRGQERADEEPA